MNGIKIGQLQNRQTAGKKTESWTLSRLLETEVRIGSSKFSDKHKEAFYLELGTLLGAGLDIKSALELLEEEQSKAEHRKIIKKIKDDLISGKALWEAVQNSNKFTPYEYYSIQIGEETGQLDVVLNQLYGYFSSKLKQRRQLVNALSYPIIVLLTSFGAVTFMLLFIVPMFSDIFKRFGGELPTLTRIIINFSTFLHDYFLILLLFGILFASLVYFNRNKSWMKQFSARLIGRVPVIGKIVYSIQLARFCTSMSLLLGSKVPLLRSLKLIDQMIVFYPLQVTFNAIGQRVIAGESLHKSMSVFKIYNKRMVSIIKVGEEVNKLDIFFGKLANQFASDAEHQTSLLNTFLEPLMILFLGFVVGFILLAMYLPMFELSTAIGG